ncbi:hypothetical protein R1flu_013499 [Riccia fluitans]|uniref:Calcineurin-like phosphoesterase domain-containing protein n=1 Tax=Riccia fluitans TaxID=41844 RepID=A0ABD1YDK5_9MARC
MVTRAIDNGHYHNLAEGEKQSVEKEETKKRKWVEDANGNEIVLVLLSHTMLLCRVSVSNSRVNSSRERIPSLKVEPVLVSNDKFIRLQKVRRKYTGRGRSRFRAMLDTPAHQEPSSKGKKIFLISDVHTDHEENLEWIRGLSSTDFSQHTLILAGDVTDNLKSFEITMTLLTSKFRDVFFVPGNHDLWCRRKEDNVTDSLTKLEKLTETCSSLGVLTSPANISGVWIVPLLSWYHESFDRERDIEGYNIPPVHKACTDYGACKWPAPLSTSDDSIARHIDELNDVKLRDLPDLQHADCQVISFSHFLPRFELCPEKRMLLYPNLPKMVGSDWLEARVRKIHGQKGSPTACHLFGHTHFAWDATLDGIRYIQAPLAYPKERARKQISADIELPLCIYDSERGGLLKAPIPSRWSEYYRLHKRDPNNQQLAPWVESHYHPQTDTPTGGGAS